MAAGQAAGALQDLAHRLQFLGLVYLEFLLLLQLQAVFYVDDFVHGDLKGAQPSNAYGFNGAHFSRILAIQVYFRLIFHRNRKKGIFRRFPVSLHSGPDPLFQVFRRRRGEGKDSLSSPPHPIPITTPTTYFAVVGSKTSARINSATVANKVQKRR